jgi:hypothetical protein
MLCKSNMQRLWDLETIGIQKETETTDKLLEQKFRETTTFKDGRYQ